MDDQPMAKLHPNGLFPRRTVVDGKVEAWKGKDARDYQTELLGHFDGGNAVQLAGEDDIVSEDRQRGCLKILVDPRLDSLGMITSHEKPIRLAVFSDRVEVEYEDSELSAEGIVYESTFNEADTLRATRSITVTLKMVLPLTAVPASQEESTAAPAVSA